MAEILDGKLLAEKIKEGLKEDASRIKKETGCMPRLVNIIIGDNPGACSYADSQKKMAAYIGIDYELKVLPQDISQQELNSFIEKINADPSNNGIMIHKPVPPHIDYSVAANLLNIVKDVEGVNMINIGQMLLGKGVVPCTPASVMAHIKSTSMNLRGKEAVIIGHSEIVGKPLSLLLLREYATVTVCHIATSEAGRLAEHVARADVLISAVGKAFLIKGEWIKKGAIVIDVGINHTESGRIVGDVEFDVAKDRAAFITPVPGGVGPVTVVMLMKNGIEAFKKQYLNKEGGMASRTVFP